MLAMLMPPPLEPAIALDVEPRDDPELNLETGGLDAADTREEPEDGDPSSEQGAFGPYADSGRKSDDDEDSGLGFDEFDDDEIDDDDDLNDDLDEDEDDDVEDDLDDFDDTDDL